MLVRKRIVSEQVVRREIGDRDYMVKPWSDAYRGYPKCLGRKEGDSARVASTLNWDACSVWRAFLSQEKVSRLSSFGKGQGARLVFCAK